MGGKRLYLHSGDRPWAPKHMAMAGFCVYYVAWKIHPACGDLSCIQTSDSFLQHIVEKHQHGHMVILKEVTKLKGILWLAYEPVLISEGSPRKQFKTQRVPAECLCGAGII